MNATPYCAKTSTFGCLLANMGSVGYTSHIQLTIARRRERELVVTQDAVNPGFASTTVTIVVGPSTELLWDKHLLHITNVGVGGRFGLN